MSAWLVATTRRYGGTRHYSGPELEPLRHALRSTMPRASRTGRSYLAACGAQVAVATEEAFDPYHHRACRACREAVSPMTWLALSVRPPWSWAIAHSTKDVENRTGGVARWRRALDADGVLIHASTSWSRRGAASPLLYGRWWQLAGFPVDAGPIRGPDRLAGRLVHPTITLPDPRLRIQHAAIVAACRVVDVHQAEPECCPSPWAERYYPDAGGELRRDVVHLVLADRRPLPHDGIFAKGRLGLWRPDPELLADVLDELPA